MRPRFVLSLGNFFSAAHFFLVIYILAPYLATFMPAEETGIIVSMGALGTLVLFPLVPKIVARYGARRLSLIFGAAEAIVLLLLAANPVPVLAMIFAAVACTISPFIAYGLDLLLEATVHRGEEGMTGRIRATFLTCGNLALVLAPFVVGLLLDSTDAYWRVFLAAAASLAPFLLLFWLVKLPEGQIPEKRAISTSWSCIRCNVDLVSIIGSGAVLQFFYHLAPLYIPLYLHLVLGISWSTLGWIFAVMLLPFVLIEYPAGRAADRSLGDKFLLAAGFLVTGISFGAIALFTTETSLITIILVLIATRVGAALIEAMTESHFFRIVTEHDVNTVSVFRMARPVGALIAPLVGSILLAIGGYYTLFLVTGTAILLLGMTFAFNVISGSVKDETFPATA